ncbi:PepSY domain-containing protein, partial [Streptomyces sp. Act-28]
AGAVYSRPVHFAAARGPAGSAAFPVTAEQAEATARELTGDHTTAAAVVADTWNTSRWTVTFDRGPAGRPEARVPDADRVEIDARTGEVLSRTTA